MKATRIAVAFWACTAFVVVMFPARDALSMKIWNRTGHTMHVYVYHKSCRIKPLSENLCFEYHFTNTNSVVYIPASSLGDDGFKVWGAWQTSKGAVTRQCTAYNVKRHDEITISRRKC